MFYTLLCEKINGHTHTHTDPPPHTLSSFFLAGIWRECWLMQTVRKFTPLYTFLIVPWPLLQGNLYTGSKWYVFVTLSSHFLSLTSLLHLWTYQNYWSLSCCLLSLSILWEFLGSSLVCLSSLLPMLLFPPIHPTRIFHPECGAKAVSGRERRRSPQAQKTFIYLLLAFFMESEVM